MSGTEDLEHAQGTAWYSSNLAQFKDADAPKLPVAQDPAGAFNSNSGPARTSKNGGDVLLVTAVDARLATARLWQMLQDPKTFGQ